MPESFFGTAWRPNRIQEKVTTNKETSILALRKSFQLPVGPFIQTIMLPVMWLIPSWQQKEVQTAEVNCLPLSVVTVAGKPNLHVNFCERVAVQKLTSMSS
jgi:hypothetical protein